MSSGTGTKPLRALEKNGARISIFSNTELLFSAARDEILRVLADALAKRGTCHVALAGGSTPKSVYALIRRSVEDHTAPLINWSAVHFYFGDERCVPPNHVDSNYKMAMESLFAGGAIPQANIHRVQAELSPAQAAEQYEKELRAQFGKSLPAFDLILLGMGPDGHAASLFPGTQALTEKQRWVTDNWVPKFDASRITFTLPVLNNAREVLFLAAGAEKQPAIAQVFSSEPSVPAGWVHPLHGELLWMLTEDAAAPLFQS